MGDAEVDEDGVAVADEEDVAGLDVAVDHPGGVDGVQRLGQPGRHPVQLLRRERAEVGDVLVEGGAVDVAGDDVGGLAVDVGVDDRRDEAAADPGQRVDLAGQAGPGVGVVRDVRAEHLDGHGAALPVQPEVDHAHPALTEALDEPVGPEAHVLARLVGVRPGAVGVGVRGHGSTVGARAGRALEAPVAGYCWM